MVNKYAYQKWGDLPMLLMYYALLNIIVYLLVGGFFSLSIVYQADWWRLAGAVNLTAFFVFGAVLLLLGIIRGRPSRMVPFMVQEIVVIIVLPGFLTSLNMPISTLCALVSLVMILLRFSALLIVKKHFDELVAKIAKPLAFTALWNTQPPVAVVPA